MELLKLTPDEFRRIAKTVYDHAGIHIDECKLGLLSNRLRKRLRALNLDSFEAYFKLLNTAAGFEQEQPQFLSAVTTNETYFFRNDRLWKSMEEQIIPGFMESKTGSNRQLRVWSAASSTGAEAYTAAILLREKLPDFKSWCVTIIGSDISKKVLDEAQAGLYAEYAVAKVSPDRLKRWFVRDGDRYEVVDEIRKMVQFRFHNLREEFPNARFDLVFLRNVLMYFDTAMKKRVLDVMFAALAPGGVLIVGDVDPIRTIPELNNHLRLDYLRPGMYGKPVEAGAKRTFANAVTT